MCTQSSKFQGLFKPTQRKQVLFKDLIWIQGLFKTTTSIQELFKIGRTVKTDGSVDIGVDMGYQTSYIRHQTSDIPWLAWLAGMQIVCTRFSPWVFVLVNLVFILVYGSYVFIFWVFALETPNNQE